MWSSRPLTACRLEESGIWVDVPDTHLELVLANDVTSLISYSMVVVAAKPQFPGSSFLGEERSNGGTKDFLQVGGSPTRGNVTKCIISLHVTPTPYATLVLSSSCASLYQY